MRHKLVLVSCAMLWLPAVVGAWAGMARFTHTPGAQGAAPQLLPVGLLPFAGQRATPQLIVALHPQCSCSIATLHELGRALARSDAKPRVTLLVYTPGTLPAHWKRQDALFAAALPLHAQVVEDRDGRLAARAGAKTSGQVLLYAADGRLLFAGGVTDERGHEGESAAGDLLAQALAGRQHGPAAASVFGCPIIPPSAAARTRIAAAGGLL